MFEKFASTPARKPSTKSVELPVTTAFVQALVSEGLRLSYGALAQAAREPRVDEEALLGQLDRGLAELREREALRAVLREELEEPGG